MVKDFLLTMAACHTVVPEKNQEAGGELNYQSSSPDEGALVKGASLLGYVFHTRRPKEILIKVVCEDF